MMEKIELQSPIAVANFIIEVANEKENPVTNLKLQKVLFFLQGYCLAEYNSPLIDGNFSKWQYGPVEEEVYQEFKYFGASPINSKSTQLRIDSGKIEFYCEEISMSDNLLNKIKEIVEQIIKKEPWQLVRLTHDDPSWKNYEDKIRNRTVEDYTNEEIKDCFKANQEVLGV